MCFQTIARQFYILSLLTVATAATPAIADSGVVNSDMAMSAPQAASPIHLTIKHPKNTPVHVSIVTDPSTGGVVEYNAPATGAPSIAYAFPTNGPRNIKVFDGAGQSVWSLIDGRVQVAGSDGPRDRSRAILAQLDRDYTLNPAAFDGFYALRIKSVPEFLASTDVVKTNPTGTNRRWAHHSNPTLALPTDSQSESTTIIVGPSAYVVAPTRQSALD